VVDSTTPETVDAQTKGGVRQWRRCMTSSIPTNCFEEVTMRLVIGGSDFEVDAKKTALALA
jgi:hypothetical protein